MPYEEARREADCPTLARLVLRHRDDSHYEVADRLAKQLGLSAREKLRLRQQLRRYLEGTYTDVTLR